MQNERVLVIVLAETRAHEFTFERFKTNLLDIYRADLALCVANNPREDTSNPFYTHAKYIWTRDEPDDWGDAFDEAQRALGARGNWRRLLEINNQWLGGIKGDHAHPGSAGILLYFRWFLKQSLISANVLDEYDRFVVTRSDFVHRVPSPPIRLLAPDKIWIPYGESYGGYTDRHFIANREHILPVLSITDPVLEAPDDLYEKMVHAQNWNLERYIKFAFEEQGLCPQIGAFPYTMYCVRAEGGHTRWSAGTYNQALGYCIKYQGEYQRAMLAAGFVKSSAQWSSFKMWLLMRLIDAIDQIVLIRARLLGPKRRFLNTGRG